MNAGELAIELAESYFQIEANNLGISGFDIYSIFLSDIDFDKLKTGNEVIGGAYIHSYPDEYYIEFDGIDINIQFESVIAFNLTKLAMNAVTKKYSYIEEVVIHELYHAFQHIVIDEFNDDNTQSEVRGIEKDIIVKWVEASQNEYDYNSSLEEEARSHTSDLVDD